MAESNYRLQALAGLAACRTDSETPVLVGQRKRLALLAALAASDNSGVPRDRLLTWFWPEADATRARNALKQLVHAIRRELGADVIVDANGFLALAPDVMTSDVQSFREALRTGALVRAVEIYRGPFLDGIYVPDVPEFERWTEETRQGLVTDYANALARLAESALESGDAAAAVSWARGLVALDSLRTRSVLLYMRALDAAGDPGAAIQQGELHARVLREELGAPSPVDIERMLYGLRQPHAPLPATAGPESASASSTERRSTGEPADRSVYAAAAALDNPSAVAASEPLPWTRRSWSTRRVWLASVLALAAVALAAATRRATSSTLEPRRVVIASFDNRTGDSTLDAFGRIAADIITEQLARAGIVNVVDAATALANSQQVRGSTPLIDSPQALESLARTTHSRIVVTGSYFRDGDDLVAQARVTDAATNDVLAATEPVRGPVAQPDRLIHLLQQRVMGALALRLDERLATIVPAGNTPTYEAYQSFVAGFDMLMSGRFVKSAPYFDRAYALDTTFLESLIWEASALPPPAAAKTRAVVDILKRRRAELTQVQRYALDEREALLDDKLDVALAAARRAAELAPGSYWKLEIATLLFRLGRPQDAVDVWSTIDRDHGWPTRSPGLWMGYVWELHDAGLHREELARVREARARFPESDGFVRQEAIALAANHKWNELDQDIAALEHRSPVELAVVASELRVHSERDRANAIYDRLVRSYAAHVPTAMDAVDFQTQRAHALYNAGRWNEAERLLDSLDSDGRQPAYIRPLWVSWLALARARVGDRARATAVLDSLVGDTASHNLGMRFSLARLAAVLGDRTRAMELLQSLRDLPGDWQHYDTDAADFDSLVGYPPYETLRGGR